MTSLRRSKRLQSLYSNGVDHISNMPDAILNSILSRLQSTKQVVRTSVLSTRWRYVWTSIPNVDINIYQGKKPFNTEEFEKFVDRVLVSKTLDLDRFRLACSSYCTMSTISRWIELAVMRKVKLLHLMFSTSEKNDIELPDCLVNCRSLDVLKLSLSMHRLSLSKVTGFRTLKVLELNKVELDNHDLVQEFFVNCLLLEDLSILDCVIYKLGFLCISCPELKNLRIDNRKLTYCHFTYDWDGYTVDKLYDNEGLCDRLTVRCPKLEYLGYGGHMANHFSFDVPSLKKAVIYSQQKETMEDEYLDDEYLDDEYMEDEYLEDEYLGKTICELFSEVSHVESLLISHYFVQCLNDKGDYPASLPNLKTLVLTIDGSSLNVLFCILKCYPNLESLHLIIKEDFSPQEFSTLVRGLDEVETRQIFNSHLKSVEFLEFTGVRIELDIARLLLGHGNALEKMVFSWCYNAKYHKRTKRIMEQVSKFVKASSSVEVISDQRQKLFVDL